MANIFPVDTERSIGNNVLILNFLLYKLNTGKKVSINRSGDLLNKLKVVFMFQCDRKERSVTCSS